VSPGKIHRFLDSRPLSLSPQSEGPVEPGQAASRAAGAYKPEVRGRKGSKDNAGEAWKERAGQESCFSHERAEEKRSIREPTHFQTIFSPAFDTPGFIPGAAKPQAKVPRVPKVKNRALSPLTPNSVRGRGSAPLRIPNFLNTDKHRKDSEKNLNRICRFYIRVCRGDS
jgi:hypothetical protein